MKHDELQKLEFSKLAIRQAILSGNTPQANDLKDKLLTDFCGSNLAGIKYNEVDSILQFAHVIKDLKTDIKFSIKRLSEFEAKWQKILAEEKKTPQPPTPKNASKNKDEPNHNKGKPKNKGPS